MQSFGVARLSISSLCGMRWSFVNSSEVLLLDGFGPKGLMFRSSSKSHRDFASKTLRFCLCNRRFGSQESIFRCLFCFFEAFSLPKIPFGLEDQDLSVLQGSSSRLMVPFTFVIEFVTHRLLWMRSIKKLSRLYLFVGLLMFLSIPCLAILWLFWHLLPLFPMLCMYPLLPEVETLLLLMKIRFLTKKIKNKGFIYVVGLLC